MSISAPKFRHKSLDSDVWHSIEPDTDGSAQISHDALRATLQSRGFVLIKRAVSEKIVTDARERVVQALESVGEALRLGKSAYATGVSRRGACEREPGELWSLVTRSRELLTLAQGDVTAKLMTALMGEPVCAERAIYVRSVGFGLGSAVHTDYPPVMPPHPSALKIWIALSPVEPQISGLFLLPMQGALSFLQTRSAAAAVRLRDLVCDGFDMDPSRWLRRHRVRAATASLNPGDAFVFESMCPHGSFDNTCTTRRLRLSCDIGWQATRLACSEHVGPPPVSAAAYSCFVGARLPVQIG